MREHPLSLEEMLEQQKRNEEIRKQNMMENEKNSMKDPLAMTAEEYLEDMKEDMEEDEKLTEEELNRKIQNMVTKLGVAPELIGNVGAFLSKVTGLHDNFNITRSDVSEYLGDDEDVISPFR